MPWNNQNGGGGSGGGGWKSGGNGGGPWGQGPWGSGQPGGGGGSGGGNQPDLEEILKRSQDRMKQAMGSGSPGPMVLFAAAAIGAAVMGWFAFTFTVQPDELGVVMRFGQFERRAEPGLNFKWPYPVEQVLLPKVTRVNSIPIGMRSVTGRSSTVGITDVPEESLMLTGDENIIDVDFVVFWRINVGNLDEKTGQTAVEQYLFNLQNPEATVKVVAESAMREVVGQSDLQPILTADRQKVEDRVRDVIQKTLDSYGSGVLITQVQLQKVDPPNKVIDAFRDVQAARADQSRIKNEAQAYANRIVPEARGDAERILQKAEGYKEQTVQEATGQAARFKKVLEEFSKAPEVTRKRIFLETMERVFADTDKVILDSSGGGQGVVPYLPLNELQKSNRPTVGGN